MYTKTNPFRSHLQERTLLTAQSSTKKTYHLVLDTHGVDFPFKVGDSVGVLPSNDPEEVELILKAIGAYGTEIVHDARGNTSLSIREFLLYKTNLARAGRAFLERLVEKGAPLRTVLESNATSFLQTHTVLELLQFAPLAPTEIASLTMPLLPRFYSIANSAKVHPAEIHLLVAHVCYELEGKIRRGVGSHYLCDLALLHTTPIPIYVQPSNHFTLPPPDASIIMVGPGTGVAPFRAFLQERLATQASGRNWLFFGERNRASDYYYEPFWADLVKQSKIRLDLAFSRDQTEKCYVQHKMYEERKSLWNWIEQGAYLYVCGDAEKMAKDVDATLLRIVQEEGRLNDVDARGFIKKMRMEKRYLVDVY